MDKPIEHSQVYQLTPGECNAEGLMSLSLLGEKVIVIASEHAALLGIGHKELLARGMGWVLGRISIEMKRMPTANETYRIDTWIESYNRRFSSRNMAIMSEDRSEVMGYVRTQWMAIEYATRQGADLAQLGVESFPVCERECPMERPRRIAPVGENPGVRHYTFGYTDIDCNRHVDTVRYIDLLMDCHDLAWHDAHTVERFDMAFHHECLYGQDVEVRYSTEDLITSYEIFSPAGRAMSASIVWKQTEVC